MMWSARWHRISAAHRVHHVHGAAAHVHMMVHSHVHRRQWRSEHLLRLRLAMLLGHSNRQRLIAALRDYVIQGGYRFLGLFAFVEPAKHMGFIALLPEIPLGPQHTNRMNATPLGFPVILSRRMFFCTISPYLPNITSSSSSVTVFGRFVTYRLVSLISSPDGRAYETWESEECLNTEIENGRERGHTLSLLLRTVTPLRHFKARCAPSSVRKLIKP